MAIKIPVTNSGAVMKISASSVEIISNANSLEHKLRDELKLAKQNGFIDFLKEEDYQLTIRFPKHSPEVNKAIQYLQNKYDSILMDSDIVHTMGGDKSVTLKLYLDFLELI